MDAAGIPDAERIQLLDENLANTMGGEVGCTVIGGGTATNVANAAWANGMIGYAAVADGGRRLTDLRPGRVEVRQVPVVVGQ